MANRFIELLACPACQGALADAAREGLRWGGCGAAYGARGGVPDLPVPGDSRTEAVRAFYTDAPFPNYPPNDTLSGLRGRAARSELARLLDEAIPGDASVLELGCGTGQMSLFLATCDRRVVGADITRASLDLAASKATLSPILACAGAFDVVYCSGVLHHTPDPRASFRAMARLAKPGGVVVLGLYNAYARLPHRARRAIARLTRFSFIPFDPVLRARDAEPERRRAWLRDQYMHPEEHRHTLGEVQRWFRENDVDYLRTYPNALIGAEPLARGELFEPAEDDWGFENLLSQVGWAAALAREGGLWVTVGRRQDRAHDG